MVAIVRMKALGLNAVDAMNGLLIRVGADLKNLVIVHASIIGCGDQPVNKVCTLRGSLVKTDLSQRRKERKGFLGGLCGLCVKYFFDEFTSRDTRVSTERLAKVFGGIYKAETAATGLAAQH